MHWPFSSLATDGGADVVRALVDLARAHSAEALLHEVVPAGALRDAFARELHAVALDHVGLLAPAALDEEQAERTLRACGFHTRWFSSEVLRTDVEHALGATTEVRAVDAQGDGPGIELFFVRANAGAGERLRATSIAGHVAFAVDEPTVARVYELARALEVAREGALCLPPSMAEGPRRTRSGLVVLYVDISGKRLELIARPPSPHP